MQPLKKRDALADGVAVNRKLVQALSRLELDDQVAQLKDLLTSAWNKSSQKALIKAISSLSSLTGPITLDELNNIQEDVSRAMGADFEALVSDDILSTTEAVYKIGFFQVLPSGASIMFGLPDIDAIRTLDSNARFWIKSYFDDNMQEAFRAQLNDYFLGGYTRAELATLMRVHFADMTSQKDSYWDLLADHTATKIREIGRLAGYKQAGVSVVRVKARLDERTTEFCRRVHGHVISIEALENHVANYLNACKTNDKDAIKASWPWWSDKDAKRKLTSAGAINRQIKNGTIGLPPYHARCRTITVAEFEAAPGSHIHDPNWDEAPIENPIQSHRADPRRASDAWAPVKPERPVKTIGRTRTSIPAPGPARALTGDSGLLEDAARGYETPRLKPVKTTDLYLTEDLDRPPRIPKPKGWEEIPGTQAGSNTGGQFIGPDRQKHYVKFYADPKQGRHEALANDLTNKLGGIGAPKSSIEQIKVNGTEKTGLASKWIDDAEQLRNPNRKFTKAEKKQLAKHYLNASLLGNWDVVGASFDNLVKSGRKWYAIDQGGAFMYRAQGGIKQYGAVVDELESLLLPGRRAGKVFNPILAETINADPDEYIKWLKKLTDRKIKNSVKAAGLEGTGIEATIAARRDYIVGHLKGLRRAAPGEGIPVGPKKVAPRGHLGRETWWDDDEALELIRQDIKAAGRLASEETIRKVAHDINSFTGNTYKDMRNAQMGRTNNAYRKAQALAIEEYLDVAAPYPKNATLYRGMDYKADMFRKMKIGDEYELGAISSFTSKEARTFGGDTKLILKGGADYGTSVMHISQHYHEYEVLLSGRNVVRILEKREEGGRLVVVAEVARVKSLTRELIKMVKEFNDGIRPDRPPIVEKPQWLKEEHLKADAEMPEHVIFVDTGKQFIYHPGSGDNKVGTWEEIGPEHPRYDHEANL
jgi:hypothetical protein